MSLTAKIVSFSLTSRRVHSLLDFVLTSFPLLFPVSFLYRIAFLTLCVVSLIVIFHGSSVSHSAELIDFFLSLSLPVFYWLPHPPPFPPVTLTLQLLFYLRIQCSYLRIKLIIWLVKIYCDSFPSIQIKFAHLRVFFKKN